MCKRVFFIIGSDGTIVGIGESTTSSDESTASSNESTISSDESTISNDESTISSDDELATSDFQLIKYLGDSGNFFWYHEAKSLYIHFSMLPLHLQVITRLHS